MPSLPGQAISPIDLAVGVEIGVQRNDDVDSHHYLMVGSL